MYSTPSTTTLAAGTEESLKLATGEDTLVGVAVADSRVFFPTMSAATAAKARTDKREMTIRLRMLL